MFEIVENKFELGKETIYPFAAELHYYRVDKRYWSLCFERIKRAGIRLITTSAPWSLHQDKNRELDFVGLDDPRKDLTVFLELARELGFKIILRPGPYIGADWPNGGIPEFVTSDVSSLARDSAGEVIKLTGAPGFKGGYLASYMSPAFQSSVKHYYKAFVDATRNYIHPRGPIIAIEIDSAPSYGGLFAPGAADYNEFMLQREYSPFLMDLYESIKDLNNCYKTKYEDFSDVEPPRAFDGADEKSLPRIFDWFRFKERMLGRYVEEQKVIFDGYTVHPKLICTTAFGSKHLAPFYNFIDRESGVLPGGAVSYDESYPDLARRGRYLRGLGGFPWGSAFPTGRASEDPKIGEEMRPITDGERRFLLASALGSGYKGVNFRMFVDHERWYGGALRVDGSVTSGYEFTRGIADSAENMELAEMQPDVQVAVVGNRLYQWFAELPDPKAFASVRRLVNESLPGVCRDLARLKIDYNVCESAAISSLSSYKLVIIPSAEFMAESEQQAIIDLSKTGTPVALFGALPRFDEHFNDCT
ncbi:MAG TPA: beta-galactosidase, partial [candidate division Zixibacteria bacterium]|nr:beta-galactosidase [candidate division Zixibacteria bacterium]